MRHVWLGALVLVACSSPVDGSGASTADLASDSPSLGPAVPLPLASGPSATWQSQPAIARGNGQYLAAWVEAQAIHATRLDARGVPLDDRSLALSGGGFDDSPALAFDGTNYLLAWTHGEGGMRFIVATRISPQGVVLDAKPLELGRVTWATLPTVAWNGHEYLVAWVDGRDQAKDSAFVNRVYAAHIKADGTSGDADDFAVSSGSAALYPAVTAAGDTFCVAWAEGSNVVAQRLGVDPAPVLVSAGASRPAIASDGTSFYIAASQTNKSVRITRLGDAVELATLPDLDVPAVAWDQDALVVATATRTDRVGRDKTVAAVASMVSRYADRPALADGKVVLRLGDVGSDTGSFSAIVAGTKPIARGDATQRAPAIAFDGGTYLLVWEEVRNDWNRPEIWATYVRGDIFDPPFRLGPGTKPSASWDGAHFLVAWENDTTHSFVGRLDGKQPLGTTVDGGTPVLVREFLVVDGTRAVTALDPKHVAYTKWSIPPGALRLTWNGTDYIAGWIAGPDLHAERVGSGFERIVASALTATTQWSFASDDRGTTQFAWEAAGTTPGIYGKRLTGDPLPSDATRLDGGRPNARAPHVVWDGMQWLTTFDDRGEIELTRAPPTGPQSAPLTIAQGSAAHAPGGVGDSLFAVVTNAVPTRVVLRTFKDTATNAPAPTPAPNPDPAPGPTPEPSGPAVSPGSGSYDPGLPAYKQPAPLPAKASTGSTAESDGCSAVPGSRTNTSSAGVALFALLLVSGGLARRRSRVPHTRR